MSQVLLLMMAILSLPGCASPQERLRAALTFDTPGLPEWSGSPPGTSFQDSAVVHGGRFSGRLTRTSESPSGASTFAASIPVTFSGRVVELRGWLRLEDVTSFAGLWLRVDGPGGMLRLDNMQQRGLKGTSEWTEYRISLPIDAGATRVLFGALVAGTGSLWVDDLSLIVDGVPVWEAPPSLVEPDTQFVGGSGIDTPTFTPVQVEKLALLGRVWGFAKYHHPRITGGEVNWDYELFRILPAVLADPDPVSVRSTLDGWLAALGDVPPCSPCAQLPADLHLTPELGWIRDPELLGVDLSRRLMAIYDRRPVQTEQRYVSLAPNVENPVFQAEAPYVQWPLPDAGYRLLAVFRLWNIIEYWFPYRDVIGEDWDGVLSEFIPRVMGAATSTDYRLALMEMIARVHDTHANLWRNLDLRPPVGSAALPVIVRFIEGRAVVTGYSDPDLGPASGLAIGDVIDEIDGAPVDSLIAAWAPTYAASNGPTRLRDIARSLTRGAPGPVRVSGSRADGDFEVTTERVPGAQPNATAGSTHDLAGEAYQRLSDEVAYLKLSSVVAEQVPDYIRRSRGAAVLVIDIRNYPSEFVPFVLGGQLVSSPTRFASFTRGDLSNPGAFRWTAGTPITPLEPGFDGKVVVLVDEVSQSQAEYTAMAMQAAGAVVVGSTTAGADGNVSSIPLPGGVNGMMSGIGVFYPDRSPTQRVGITIDLEVRPTIRGIREGRDEVLEAGVSHAMGREFRLRR